MNTAILLAGYISLLLVLSAILLKAANITVSAAHALLNKSHANKYGLAVFFIALSQCLPELIISVVACLNGNSPIAVAAVVGSNIANISLVIGGAAFIGGSLRAIDGFIKNEIAYVLLIAALPPLLLLDAHLTRVEAILLLGTYLLYELNELQKKRPTKARAQATQLQLKRVLGHLANRTVEKKVAAFIVGTGVMLLASEAIVHVAESMATFAGIPVFMVTLVIVSIGTSLPEMVFEIMATKRRESSMVFASALGGIVTDSTLTLGLSALILPISLGFSLHSYLISVLGFVVMFGMFWRFVWSKHRLDRWEGFTLVLSYFIFAAVQYFIR